jgi:hypothetical protein
VAAGLWIGGANGVACGVAVGVAVGVAFGVAGGVVVRAPVGVTYEVAAGVVGGLAYGLVYGVAGGVAYGAGFSIEVLGLRVLLMEVGAIHFRVRSAEPSLFTHPLGLFPHRAWREQIVREARVSEGWPTLRWALRSPIRRAFSARPLAKAISTPGPLLALLSHPSGSAPYALFVPDNKRRLDSLTLHDAILSLIANRAIVDSIQVDGTLVSRPSLDEGLTAFILRRNPPFPPPMANLALGLLLLLHRVSLFDEPTHPDENCGTRLLALLQSARGLSGGDGLAEAYGALHCAGTLDDPNTLAELPHRGPPIVHPLPDHPAGAALGAAVATLWGLAADISALRLLPTDAALQAGLRDLLRRLEALTRSRPPELLPHDRALLHEVARRWVNLLLARGDRLERQAPLTAVVSHYLAGPPVPSHRLIGRESLLDQIAVAWSRPAGQGWRPLVLYGHRRMGKTSVLHSLSRRFADAAVVALVSAQGLSWDDGRAAVCRGIQLRLRRAALDAGIVLPNQPCASWEDLVSTLEDLHRQSGRRVVLALDELEYLGRDARLLDQLRALHTECWWFTPVLAGLHDLRDPFLAGRFAQLVADSTQFPVDVLSPAQARALLVQPAPEADLPFEEDAVSLLLPEAAGQPFLLQQMGELLVARVNNRLRSGDRARVVKPEDAQYILGAPLFDGARAYFEGVWTQSLEQPASEALLGSLARAGSARRSDISEEHRGALEHLLHVRVIEERDGALRFVVPAMFRWVQRRVT